MIWLTILPRAESQTTGRYPVAAVRITADMLRAAQLRFGAQAGTRDEALRALRRSTKGTWT